MNWVLVPQQLMTGLLNGGTLALIALGIVLVYRSSEVFNFAHGHMLMLGAFLTWWFASEESLGLPLPIAIIGALVVAIILGFVIERLMLRPMTGQPLLSIILMTLGLSQLLEGLTTIIFGVQPRNFPSPFAPDDVFNIPFPGGIALCNSLDINVNLPLCHQIVLKQALVASFVVAIIATVVFILFFRYTNIGLAMRAASENHELAQSMGIRVSRVFGLSWAIAGIMATLGGILLATLTGVSLNLATVALIAFPAILLGGLESFPGAIVGGLAVGVAQAIVQASKLIEVRNSSEIAPYILLLIVLIIRPEGLFGQKRIERI